MKKYLKILFIFLFVINTNLTQAEVISGNIKEDVQATRKNQVIDSKTGAGVDSAKITLKKKNYSTYTIAFTPYFILDSFIDSVV